VFTGRNAAVAAATAVSEVIPQTTALKNQFRKALKPAFNKSNTNLDVVSPIITVQKPITQDCL
jgi:hypothetical protein